MRKWIAVTCMALVGSPVWAVNKCQTPDGKTVFQDLPCANGQGGKIDVRPASGQSAIPAPTTPSAPPPAQTEGVFGEKWQRLQYLKNRGVPDARTDLQTTLATCDAQQAELAKRKTYANNNLAGATWEQSISSEMQAKATLCDAKIRDARSLLERHEKELIDLQNVVK